jgi:hypothetical protein
MKTNTQHRRRGWVVCALSLLALMFVMRVQYQATHQMRPASPLGAAEEQDIKIGYVVLVHTLDTIRASKPLLAAIWRPQHFYVFVADSALDQTSLAVLEDLVNQGSYAMVGSRKPAENVRVLQANVKAGWGEMGLVQNELDGLQALLDLGEWDFTIALSGNSFPLMSQERLAEKLAHFRGKNFLTDHGLAPFRDEDKASRVADVTWPKGIVKGQLFGTQWFVLTREFVEYALHSTLSRNLLVAMVAGEAFVPDESFFQILIVNSPFNHTVIQEGQAICRFIKWDDCNYEKYTEGSIPCYLGMKDLHEMLSSSCIFARKTEPAVSGELYDALLSTF